MALTKTITISKIVDGVKCADTGRTVTIKTVGSAVVGTVTESPANSGQYVATFDAQNDWGFWYIDAVQQAGYSNNSPFPLFVYDSVSASIVNTTAITSISASMQSLSTSVIRFSDGTNQNTAARSTNVSTSTQNYIVKFGSNSALTNSVIQDNGTEVSIGTTPTVGVKLDVYGAPARFGDGIESQSLVIGELPGYYRLRLVDDTILAYASNNTLGRFTAGSLSANTITGNTIRATNGVTSISANLQSLSTSVIRFSDGTTQNSKAINANQFSLLSVVSGGTNNSSAPSTNKFLVFDGSKYTASVYDQNSFSQGVNLPIHSASTNYIPKYDGLTSLANSVIQDNGTEIAIGTAPSVGVKLDVYGAPSRFGDGIEPQSLAIGELPGYYRLRLVSDTMLIYASNNTLGKFTAGTISANTLSTVSGYVQSLSTTVIRFNDGTKQITATVAGGGGNIFTILPVISGGTNASSIATANKFLQFDGTRIVSVAYDQNSFAVNNGATIKGSGTNNYIAKFNAVSSITNSVIQDNGTEVSIGTVPSAGVKLDVYGAPSRFADGIEPQGFVIGELPGYYRLRLVNDTILVYASNNTLGRFTAGSISSNSMTSVSGSIQSLSTSVIRFSDGTTQNSKPINANVSTSTQNYVVKFGSSSALTNSIIKDTGTNIGINIAVPDENLHVYGTGVRGIKIESSNSDASLRLYSNAASSKYWIMQSLGASSPIGNLRIYNVSDDVTALSINPNGSVGINKTPTLAKLDVNGSFRADSASAHNIVRTIYTSFAEATGAGAATEKTFTETSNVYVTKIFTYFVKRQGDRKVKLYFDVIAATDGYVLLDVNGTTNSNNWSAPATNQTLEVNVAAMTDDTKLIIKVQTKDISISCQIGKLVIDVLSLND